MKNKLLSLLFNRIISEYNKETVDTDKLNILFELFETELILNGYAIPIDDLDANLLNYESFDNFINVYK